MEDFAKIKGLYISALNNDVDIALVENMGEKYHNTRPIKVGDDDQNSINRIHLYVSCGCSRWCRFCLNLEQLKKSDGSQIAINPESVEMIRKSINKDIPKDLIWDVINDALEIGLNLRCSFMLGFLNETEEDIIELANTIKSIVKTKNAINKDLSVKIKISLCTKTTNTLPMGSV